VPLKFVICAGIKKPLSNKEPPETPVKIACELLKATTLGNSLREQAMFKGTFGCKFRSE